MDQPAATTAPLSQTGVAPRDSIALLRGNAEARRRAAIRADESAAESRRDAEASKEAAAGLRSEAAELDAAADIIEASRVGI